MADAINVSAGSQALLALSSVAGLSSVAADSNALIVPQMQDITVNNTTGVFRWKQLDSTAEKAVTTPATNQITLNAVVDEQTFFGDGANVINTVVADGLFGASKNKTKVYFAIGFEGADSGDQILTGAGYISGLAPTVNMDAPVWVTPVTIEVDGDFTNAQQS
jgi:hypothetical protein